MRRTLLGLALMLTLAGLAACATTPASQAGATPGQPRLEAMHPHSSGHGDDAGSDPSPSRGGGASPSHGDGPGPHK
jgi:ABC-type glycerol-3-phosphate transport system substrate-binding protein